MAIITNMDTPLGYKIGNNLEVQECIDVLKENGPDRYMLPVTIPLLMGLSDTNYNFKNELEKYLEEINYDYDEIMKTMHDELYKETKK